MALEAVGCRTGAWRTTLAAGPASTRAAATRRVRGVADAEPLAAGAVVPAPARSARSTVPGPLRDSLHRTSPSAPPRLSRMFKLFPWGAPPATSAELSCWAPLPVTSNRSALRVRLSESGCNAGSADVPPTADVGGTVGGMRCRARRLTRKSGNLNSLSTTPMPTRRSPLESEHGAAAGASPPGCPPCRRSCLLGPGRHSLARQGPGPGRD